MLLGVICFFYFYFIANEREKSLRFRPRLPAKLGDIADLKLKLPKEFMWGVATASHQVSEQINALCLTILRSRVGTKTATGLSGRKPLSPTERKPVWMKVGKHVITGSFSKKMFRHDFSKLSVFVTNVNLVN